MKNKEKEKQQKVKYEDELFSPKNLQIICMIFSESSKKVEKDETGR